MTPAGQDASDTFNADNECLKQSTTLQCLYLLPVNGLKILSYLNPWFVLSSLEAILQGLP